MNMSSANGNFVESENYYPGKIFWGAILAGVLAALAVSFLLNLLGAGLGFTALKVDADTFAALGISTIVWIIFSTIVSMVIGGWVAGQLSSSQQPLIGFFHGFLAWALATLITLIFITSTVGAIMSGTIALVGSGISAAGTTASAVGSTVSNLSQQVAPQVGEEIKNLVPNLTPAIEKIQEQAEEALSNSQAVQAAQQTTQAVANDPEKAKKQLKKGITDFLAAIDSGDYQQAQQKVIDALVQAGMDQNEAQENVQEWQASYNDAKEALQQKAEQAKQKTIEATEKASAMMGRIALLTFFVLLCGGIGASLSGLFAAKHAKRLMSTI